jgi:hypothetical protein
VQLVRRVALERRVERSIQHVHEPVAQRRRAIGQLALFHQLHQSVHPLRPSSRASTRRVEDAAFATTAESNS